MSPTERNRRGLILGFGIFTFSLNPCDPTEPFRLISQAERNEDQRHILSWSPRTVEFDASHLASVIANSPTLFVLLSDV